ncbi:MAG TPA: alpha/beta hydrolase family protein, partial [Clostridiales bacterium]|nr:alpha/beta hydrolase family protein [Clostridiales bacterium]
MNNSPFTLHEILLKNNPPVLTFEKNKDRDLYEWREEVRKAFAEVIRKPEKTLSSPAIIEYEKEHEDYHEIRFQFESEPSYFVPGHYLYPKNLTHKVPVII